MIDGEPAGRPGDAPIERPTDAPPPVTETARVGVFTGLAWMYVAFVIAGGIPFLLFLPPAIGVAWIVLFSVLAGVFFALSRLRITVTPERLLVATAFGGARLKTVRRADVAEISAVELAPWEWGGVGLRAGAGLRWRNGRLHRSGSWSLVLRRAPGVVISTRSGRVVAVTLEARNAAAAVALLAPR